VETFRDRKCETCGYRMAPGTPRRAKEGRMVCPSCFQGTTAAVKKEAHDAGNQVDIYHCPFCGSGQVVARSDRTVECTFCNAVFTVQVQPQYAAFPQTIDGMPVQEPGMPGMDGEPDVAPDEQLPEEQGGMDQGGGFPPGGDADQDGAPDDQEQPAEDDEEDDGKPAFLKGSRLYRTANGTEVPLDELLHHMAVLQATPEQRPAVLARIRASRETR